jgi:hypothetical protein
MSSKFTCGRHGPEAWHRYVHDVCGRVRLSSGVSEIKLVFSIPPERPTPKFPPSWNVVASAGDDKGVAVWRRITDAVGQLVNTTPPGPFH